MIYKRLLRPHYVVYELQFKGSVKRILLITKPHVYSKFLRKKVVGKATYN